VNNVTNIYFDELYPILCNNLSRAEKKVKIAVAWLNFDLYQSIFYQLLSRGIELKIIINDDHINARFNIHINNLVAEGAQIKKFRMATKKQYMHEKFCIIDNRYVLVGSYNWTKNANMNFENLIYTDDELVVRKCNDEFKMIFHADTEYIRSLQKLSRCPICNSVDLNIMVLEQEGDYQTKVVIYHVCECGMRQISVEYYDIGMYNNLIGIYETYGDMIEQVADDEEEIYQLQEQEDCDIKYYLANIRGYNNPIFIHAIGIDYYDIQDQDGGGEYIVKILWKERFVSAYIYNEYYYND